MDEEARADALETLERVGYVDDTRFAAARADSLAGRGFGDEAIRELLAGDGVGPEAVEAALAGLESEADRARALAERLGRTPKAAAQLQRKGFGPDAVEAAFGSLFAEGDAGA